MFLLSTKISYGGETQANQGEVFVGIIASVEERTSVWIESPAMMNDTLALKGPLGDPGTVELHPVYELCPLYMPAKVP